MGDVRAGPVGKVSRATGIGPSAGCLTHCAAVTCTGGHPGHQRTSVLLGVGRAPLPVDGHATEAGRSTGEDVGRMRTSPEADEHSPAEEEQAAPRLRVAPVVIDGETLPIARSEVSAMGEE